jgi:hypothetical protein
LPFCAYFCAYTYVAQHTKESEWYFCCIVAINNFRFWGGGLTIAFYGRASHTAKAFHLQKHLLAVAERLSALGASCAGRVEVVVFSGLEHLAGNEAQAVRALDAEQGLRKSGDRC